MNIHIFYIISVIDQGVILRPGPGSNFLAGAGGTDSGRAGTVDFWSRFGAQSGLLVVEIFRINIQYET